MGLIHDDGTVMIQISLPEGLSEQDPISHVFDQGVFRSAVFKANGITHLGAETQLRKQPLLTHGEPPRTGVQPKQTTASSTNGRSYQEKATWLRPHAHSPLLQGFPPSLR